MDWHIFLFSIRWAIIGLVYLILLVLLFGVYREMTLHVSKSSSTAQVTYGRLRVIHPGGDPQAQIGLIYNLRTETRLGAHRDNDIVLQDPFVSGHHVRFRWDGAAWWIEDLNSKNGTLVDRQPCLPGHAQNLPGGATITVGDMVFELLD